MDYQLVLAPIVIGLTGTAAYLIALYRRMQKERFQIYNEMLERYRLMNKHDFLHKMKVQEKMSKIFSILENPRPFYYFNKEVIVSLFNQIKDNLSIRELEEEEIQSGGIKAGIKNPIEISGEKKGSSRVKKKYEKIEESVELMYKTVETNLIRNQRLKFGLEDFVYDESIEKRFKEQCKRIEEEFDFKVPEEIYNSFREQHKRKYTIDSKLKEMKEATGFVAMQATFEISEIDDNNIQLNYESPYGKEDNEGKRITIKIICSIRELTDLGKRTLKAGVQKTLLIVGIVDRFDNDDWTFYVIPITIS